ncbi:hypothetical protein [Paenisporosarcina quisquiliarum]|uniref:hypothetical protein n=1 Tax=Paenisporosarcina quisquiliarum TaxID=365346 RepID=UPI003735C645
MKKLKDLRMFLFILILALTVPSSTFANESVMYGPGEWDVIYNTSVTATIYGTSTSTFTSGGGDVRLCIESVDPGNTVNSHFVTPSGSVLPVMSYTNTGSTQGSYFCFGKIDVRPYTDSTGKVNLYLRTTSKNQSSDAVRLVVED